MKKGRDEVRIEEGSNRKSDLAGKSDSRKGIELRISESSGTETSVSEGGSTIIEEGDGIRRESLGVPVDLVHIQGRQRNSSGDGTLMNSAGRKTHNCGRQNRHKSRKNGRLNHEIGRDRRVRDGRKQIVDGQEDIVDQMAMRKIRTRHSWRRQTTEGR
jgi:hypothetical protein